MDGVDEIQFSIKYLLVEKQQFAKGVILGRGGDILLFSQVAQELADFFFGHFIRVSLAMKQNEPSNLIDVGFLSSNRVMFRPNKPADGSSKFGEEATIAFERSTGSILTRYGPR